MMKRFSKAVNSQRKSIFHQKVRKNIVLNNCDYGVRKDSVPSVASLTDDNEVYVKSGKRYG